MTTHWIWFPVTSLKSLVKPIGPRADGFLPSTLSGQFEQKVRGASVMFARQTIMQFFHAL